MSNGEPIRNSGFGIRNFELSARVDGAERTAPLIPHSAWRIPHFARPRRGRARGFTFVEILATLALLAIVLPAVMTGISLSLSAADLARRQAQASSLGQAKLTELLSAGDWQLGNQNGDFGTDWPGYRWASQVADWDEGLLRQVDVTVSWAQRGKERRVTLSTLVQTGEELGNAQ